MQSGDSDPARVLLGPEGLRLGQSRLPLLSAAMHYFQVPRQSWEKCLDAIAGLGLPLVESYVPWSLHEREDGGFDFQGGDDARHPRDLGAFLDCCAARGLKVILRPGPSVNAELTGFGFPRRILEDERCLARGAGGNLVLLPVPPRALPVPSYASARFLAEASGWLAAVAAFLQKRCFPEGPVVALQVDNECCLFFRTGAYDQDYHPDAVGLYRSFLGERHPQGLPAGYRGARLEALEPPRCFQPREAAELAVHLDWLAFKEWMLGRALGRLAGALRDGGLPPLPLFHNLPPAELGGALLSPAALEEQLDLVGLDLYARRDDHAAVKRSLLRLAGSSRFPYLSELGWGGWPWWWPRGLEDSRATALSALMYGARGFNLYMGVERDRWYGAPISNQGQARAESCDLLRPLISAVKELDLPSLQRPVAVGLLRVRELDRLSLCTSLLDPVPPAALALIGLGPAELCADEVPGLAPGALRGCARFRRAAEAALEALQVPYHEVDSEAGAEKLRTYKLLLLPSLELLGRGLLERLRRFVDGGGRLLLGPRLPVCDEIGGRLGELPPHRLVGEVGLQAALEEELTALSLAPDLRSETAGVELAAFFEETGAPRCLFLANRGGGRTEAAVNGQGLGELRAWDALSGAPLDLRRVSLGPREIRMVGLRPAHPSGSPAGARGARP